jgi:3alpha(or 20beta)-hydroxysteroid dehydrogenase
MASQFDLSGRSALVTGGARGIGAAIATSLAEAGAAVTLGDVLSDVGAQTAAALTSAGHTAHFVALDVTDEKAWDDAVASVVKKTGGFDILINNAGVEVTALISEFDVADLRKMLDVNIVGTMLGMKHAFRAMRPNGAAGKGGSIVNISSVAATIPFPAIAGYSGTKSAVDRITRIGAVEAGKLGFGVRVNCIYPGLIATDMGMKLAQDVVAVGLWPSVEAAIGDVIGLTPLGHLAEVTDIGNAAVFLCSDAARFVTGVGLPVDGGMGT